MCECCFRFLRGFAVTINIILFTLGVGAIVAGVYGKTKVDVKEVLGKGYKEKVPPIKDFVPNSDKNQETAKLTAEADAFVDQSMDKIAEIVHRLFIALIIIGCCKCFIALLGIIAFTCCNKKNACVILFLVLMILLIVPFIFLIVVTAHESVIRGVLFEKLDNLALEEKFVNRFFMAAIQSSLGCCGVRGNVDYYCHGIYDYVCNPGCLTFSDIWNRMKRQSRTPPMCTRVPELIQRCNRIAALNKFAVPSYTKENCQDKMNIPQPIDGRESSYCKNNKYQDYYETTGDSTSRKTYGQMKDALAEFDPARKYGPNDDPRVFGDLFRKNGVTRGKVGCGFKIWKKVEMKLFLNIGLLAACIVFVLIFFQILVASLSIHMNRKEKKSNSRTKSSSNGKSSRSS